MLPTTARPSLLRLRLLRFSPLLIHRTSVTESVTSTEDPSLPPGPTSKPRKRLYPHPRPVPGSQQRPPFPVLPPSFGRNQILPISSSKRALLESIVLQFQAPIRYAFAYGSGVFEQDGYAGDERMLDFMFAVTHPGHWHSINMAQHPGHYPFHARLLGSSFVASVQEFQPGIWFNAFVPMKGVTIKYGVTTVDNLCSDLLHWNTLYLAGRMHKPLRIIKDDARVRLTQQVNLTSAVRVALLTLPQSFTEPQLFSRIASISYAGDPRMLLPAENRSKVQNIVRMQGPQFHELYHRLVTGLPGVRWGSGEKIEQDVSPQARSAHLRKLPTRLLAAVRRNYDQRRDGHPTFESDEGVYWLRLAGDERLPDVIRAEIAKIVRYPATIQSLKGVVSAGIGKSVKYSAIKVRKWWKGGRGN